MLCRAHNPNRRVDEAQALRGAFAKLSVPSNTKKVPCPRKEYVSRQFAARTLRGPSASYRRTAEAPPCGPSGHNAADWEASKDRRLPRDSTGLKAAAFEPTRFALWLLLSNEKPPAVSRRGL